MAGKRGHGRVAILAVHGVGDQRPDESARNIAELLLRLKTSGAESDAYGPIEDASLVLPTRRVSPAGLPKDEADPGLLESVEQLEGYEHDDAPYETRRFSTEALDDTGAPTTGVDVFELYWADLSRLRAGVFRILGEVYQLVFHLPTLGRRAIEQARRRAIGNPDYVPGARPLSVLGHLQDVVTFLGAVVTPMLNLAALLTGVAVLTTLAPNDVHFAFWVVAIPIVAVVSLGVAGLLGRVTPWPKVVLGSALVTALVGLAAAVALDAAKRCEWARDLRIVALAGMGVGALLAAIPIVAYARRRHAALVFGALAVALVMGTFTWSAWFEKQPQHAWHDALTDRGTAMCWAKPGERGPCVGQAAARGVRHGHRASTGREWSPRHRQRVILAAVRALEVVFAALNVAWVLLLVSFSAFIAYGGALSFVARWARRSKKSAKHEAAERLRRAIATARLTTSMSLLLFLLVTVPIGAALVAGVANCVCLDVPFHTWIRWIEWGHCIVSAGSFVGALPSVAITPAAPLMTAVIAVALMSFAVPLLPNALSELRVPRGRRFAGLFGLDVATQGVRFASLLVVVAIGTYFLGVFLTPIPVRHTPIPNAWATDLESWTTTAMGELGTLLAGGAAGLLLFNGRLQKLTLGFRPVLDIALDVDSYLREEPRDKSVRGAISARLAAMLRHVTLAEYDHVVIIAHSQGTVIIADHLRFLNACGRNAERPASLSLFTMGSPLRQLYAARFPHLYQWAEGRALNGPDPKVDLGIDTWVNAFRSGDYVGRALFSPDPAGVVPETDPKFERDTSVRDPSPTRDVWVGLGAHTHYWDGSAPVVARELDRLVRRV